MCSGVVFWYVVLCGEGWFNVGGQIYYLCVGDVVFLFYGLLYLMESLVEWGQVLLVVYWFNGMVMEMCVGLVEGVLEMLCGEFYFGLYVSWLFSEVLMLIYFYIDVCEDCLELDVLFNILVCESLVQCFGGSVIVCSFGDMLLVFLLCMLFGE